MRSYHSLNRKKFLAVKFVDNKYFMNLAVFMTAVILFSSEMVYARPEYALRFGINRCTVCHYSPAGGGARNLQGKYFGAVGFKTQGWLQNNDMIGLEAKFLYYRPESPKDVKGGMGVMLGDIWASIPVREKTEDQSEIRLVAEQNVGGFSASPRQWYLRWNFSDDLNTSWLPQYLLFGRFIPAFGLLSDEHRIYVRQQTGTTWNQGLDNGFYIAANPYDSFHYDISVVNGRKNSGTQIQKEMADQWGYNVHFRLMPQNLPVAFGQSHSFYSGTSTTENSVADSIYSIISFHRITGNKVPASLSLEYVQAKNWNDVLATSFISDTSYANTVVSSKSAGALALLDYELTSRLSMQVKYDELIVNQDYPADRYRRYGVGFKTYHANNVWGMLRYEKAEANQPTEQDGKGVGAQDALYMVLSVAI